MSNMTAHETLMRDLKAAPKGSQALDERIAALVYGEPEFAVLPGGQRSKSKLFKYGNGLMGSLVPAWTAYLDASRKMVPKGCAWGAGKTSDEQGGRGWAWVQVYGDRPMHEAATPALALCMASRWAAAKMRSAQ